LVSRHVDYSMRSAHPVPRPLSSQKKFGGLSFLGLVYKEQGCVAVACQRLHLRTRLSSRLNTRTILFCSTENLL
jgi:hypothetical protein